MKNLFEYAIMCELFFSKNVGQVLEKQFSLPKKNETNTKIPS